MEDKLSLADGLKLFHKRGALTKPVRLTKKRAAIILMMLKQFEECFDREFDCVEDEEMYHEFQQSIQWVFNKINSRWSQSDIYVNQNELTDKE